MHVEGDNNVNSSLVVLKGVFKGVEKYLLYKYFGLLILKFWCKARIIENEADIPGMSFCWTFKQ